MTVDRWQSMAIAVAVTASLFACAFAAMTSRADWNGGDGASRASTTDIIALPFQEAAPPLMPAPRSRPTALGTVPRMAPATPATPGNASRAQPADIGAPALIRSVAPRVPLPPVSADSGTARGTPSANPAAVTSVRGGAPIAPAGVTGYGLSPDVRAARDSLIPGASVGPLGASRSLFSPPTATEREVITDGQRRADMLERRSTSGGNTRDLVIMHGNGADGAGAAGNGKSIGLRLFSSGPSAAQRKKNAALDTEYNARLRRLEKRVQLKRDSARLDSLRRDSIRAGPSRWR